MILAPRSDFLHNHPQLEAEAQEDSPGIAMRELVLVDCVDWAEARRILFANRAAGSVTLSRRNLLTLLSKLEQVDSHRTIIKPNGMVVMAESDEDHYQGRRPGMANEKSERFISDIENWLDIRRRAREVV